MICRGIVVFVLWLFAAGGAFAQGCPGVTTLVNGTNADANAVNGNFTAVIGCINNLSAPRGYLSGLTLSTLGSQPSFGVAVGVATSDDATTYMKLATSLSKTTTAWSVGTGTGSLDTGVIQNGMWYHVFLIERIDTGVVDVLISQSPTAPTLPASYTKQRRIGSIKTDGSGNWLKFVQVGDDFLWAAHTTDLAPFTVPATTATLTTLSVPSGVQVTALYDVGVQAGPAGIGFLITSPDENDVGPFGSNPFDATIWAQANAFVNAQLRTRTSTSAQIRWRINVVFGSPGPQIALYTVGWTDTRGK